jgi:polysaccharide biosynthesis protein PslG
LTRNRLLVLAGLAALLLIALLWPRSVVAPPIASAPTARPTDLGAGLVKAQRYPSLGYGVHAFLWWNEATRGRDLEYVRQLRFQYVKQIFGWKDVWPDPATPPDWSKADAIMAEAKYRAVKVVARLGKVPAWAERPALDANGQAQPPFDTAAFAQFCGQLAARYVGQMAGYQVLNEVNLDREWLNNPPNAKAYVTALAACGQAIKAADPAAVIISAGLAPTGTHTEAVIPADVFLSQFYAEGGTAHYDVLGLNAPGYLLPPETAPDDPRLNGQRWQVFRYVEDMRALMVAAGEGAKQVAILEMGWTTDTREQITLADGSSIANPYRWHAVTEPQQADYLVRAYNYAGQNWRPWMGLMVTIYLPDINWTEANEEYWWALMTPGYNPFYRDSFIALANAARYIDANVTPAIGGADNPYTPLPPMPTTKP